ncbi:MAG: M1 family metallopeptidase [Actinobacteria bacterium]|nr:M1 family metallopeptidase [Actinomycetota bacterium]
MHTRLLIGRGTAVIAAMVFLLPTSHLSYAGSAPSPSPLTVGSPPVPGADGIGDPYFPRAGNGGYDVTHYDIQLHYDPATDRLEGHTTVVARSTQNLSRLNLDLRLSATAAEVNGRPATIHQDGGELQVTPAQPVRAGQSIAIHVDYAGVPSRIQDSANPIPPWMRTSDGAVGLGEPDIAAWWYPSNDHPSDKATMAVTATVPTGVEVISNGALLGGSEPAGPGWQRWRWRVAEPMAPYLAFIAIGQYDLVRRRTPAGAYLAAYAQNLDPQVARRARAAVERTPEIVGFLAQIFGPYPFRQLGGVVINNPAMSSALENQTRPVYGPTVLSDSPDDVTGSPEDITLMVHELAHQWFGDSVSVRRWRDIWLNEGFATYAEWLYSERTGGPSAQQVAERQYRLIPADDDFWRIAPGDPGAAKMFSSPVYRRGAMALQALRAGVGDKDFFAALRAWAMQRRGGNGTVEDFIAVIEWVSGQQVDDIAETWLFRPARPPAPPGQRAPAR